NLGDGTLLSGRARYSAGFAPWAMDLADMNGDGSLDAIATSTGSSASETPGITVLLNNGDATFGPDTHYPETIVPASMHVLDVDGDLDPDVVFRSRAAANDERLAIMFNNGDGTLAPTIYIPILGTYAQGIDLVDLDQDGDPDLVYIFRNDVMNPGGSTTSSYFTGFLFNDGTGDFVDSAFIQDSSFGWATVFGADFNNDSHPDLLFGGLTNKIGVRLSQGDGTWGNAVTHPAGVFTQDHETFDVDNDGDIDIVTSDRLDSTISVHLNNGDGTFAPRISYPMPGDPYSLSIGDVNDDGFIDLAAPMFENNINGDFRKMVVILNDGTGAFVDIRIYDAGSSSLYSAIGDLNNDGALDLAFVDSNDDDLSVYLNLCGGTAPCPADCSPDNGDGTVGNGSVNIDDLLAVINAFGDPGGPCDNAPDNGDGTFGN
ncbi:MAG: VCBS repeat-containing protein, partial [Phycisphaerales bacterium]|nr:VCBS repeat-containing protein [Phycisphaerales bacterium]